MKWASVLELMRKRRARKAALERVVELPRRCRHQPGLQRREEREMDEFLRHPQPRQA